MTTSECAICGRTVWTTPGMCLTLVAEEGPDGTTRFVCADSAVECLLRRAALLESLAGEAA